MSIKMADRFDAKRTRVLFTDDRKIWNNQKEAEELVAAIPKAIKDSVHIDVSNIFEYHASTYMKHKRIDLKKVFPYTAPPFNDIWMETSTQGLAGYEYLKNFHFKKLAAHISAKSFDFNEPYLSKENMIATPDGTPIWIGKIVTVIIYSQLPVSDDWAIEHSFTYVIDHQGEMQGRILSSAWEDTGMDMGEDAFFSVYALPFLMAISFMHCKNVKKVDNPIDKKLNKAFTKRNKKPLLVFKTLQIEPNKETIRNINSSEANLEEKGKMRLHICRGYFAIYTPEKGFWGKPLKEPLKVWRDSYAKGSKVNGEVVKDYNIKL